MVRHSNLFLTLLSTLAVFGASASGKGTAERATVITRVFGDGIRPVAVAVEYDDEITDGEFAADRFAVEGRTVTGIFVSTSADPHDRAEKGRFVIIELSPDDAGVSLSEMVPTAGADDAAPRKGGKRWVAGAKPTENLVFNDPVETVLLPDGSTIVTSGAENLVADDFVQLVFDDPQTGKTLKYNLFVPKSQGDEPLPLVLFMHDAGATSTYHRATLFQGTGAIVWASPEEQAKRPCFVLAPQYDEIIVDDDSRASAMLETTIHLIEKLTGEYRIDTDRLYTTGQSGGCMMSIAMNIRYPDLFAAAYLVAGQWDPDVVAPLARKKLWIMVSADDKGAFPGENAITERLAAEGAVISRAIWDATWSADMYRFAYDSIVSERSPINYTVFAPGTVFREGESTAGASGHRNTWRVAYSIEPIREWLFEQHK